MLLFFVLETYEHQQKLFIDCNFCVCFDGEVICSKSQCLPEIANNSTGCFVRNYWSNKLIEQIIHTCTFIDVIH